MSKLWAVLGFHLVIMWVPAFRLADLALLNYAYGFISCHLSVCLYIVIQAAGLHADVSNFADTCTYFT